MQLRNSTSTNLAMSLSMAAATTAYAAVSAEETKQLGGQVLTEWGAERAGNKEATIPEYTGKKPPVSPGYDTKAPGNIPDPYNEKPLFSITSQNMAQYADKLSEDMQTG